MNEPLQKRRLQTFLARAPSWVFVTYAISAAFTVYFCMYAFRKPFAAAKFEGQFYLGTTVQLKTALVISQIIGYALSKYLGIKFCSEVRPHRRAFALLLLISWSQLALVLYGLLPPNAKVIGIFLNGLPLGMVWGLVVGYLEGRRTSELLLAGLSCSYIVSSGIVKDVGRAILDGAAARWWDRVPWLGPPLARSLEHVSEAWMPAITGFHFLPLFLIALWLLDQLPRPSPLDVAARVEREPMDSTNRFAFLKRFFLGLSLLCVAYFFLTAYRDFRDNYQVELFDELGYSYAQNKTIISQTETLVAFGVIGALALLNCVHDNRQGLIGAFGIMTLGVVLLGAGTLFFEFHLINGFWWMTLTGLGSYLAYVPYGSVLFDRLIASTRVVGTAVFAIYLADAIGYTGSVGIQLYKDVVQSNVSRLLFFKHYTYFMAVLGTVCLLTSCIYFLRRSSPTKSPAASLPS